MTTYDLVSSSNPDAKISKSKAKKLAKKEAKSDGATPTVESAAESVEGDDAPRKNPYAELIAKKLRTLKKKLTKIESTEKQDKATLNPDQVRMLEQKSEVVVFIKDYEEVMTHINRIEQEEMKSNARKQAESVRETQQQIASAVAEVKRAAEQDVQSVLKLFYIFADAIQSDGRITGEQLYGIDYLRAILQSREHESPSDYLSKTTPHMTELLSKSQNMLTPGASYESIMEAIDILVTIPPLSISTNHHHAPLQSYSPGHQANAGVPSFVAAEEDETTVISGGQGIVRMPPMQLGAGGITAGNLNFFTASEVTGEDPYQPLQNESNMAWGDMPVTDVTALHTNHGIATEPIAWADDIGTTIVYGTEEQTDSGIVEGQHPVPSTANIPRGQAAEFQQHRGRGRGGRGGYRGYRGYRGDRGNGHRGGYRARGGYNNNRGGEVNGDGGEWQTASYSNNGYQEGRGGYRGGRGRGGGFRGNRDNWQEGAPRSRGRGRGGYSNNHSNDQQAAPQ